MKNDNLFQGFPFPKTSEQEVLLTLILQGHVSIFDFPYLSGEFIYIPSLFNSFENFGYINEVKFYTFDYLIDGINFIEHNEYNLKHKGF